MITHDEIVMETLPDHCPDTSYLEQEGCEERLRQYRDGCFGFIGIRASCTLQIGTRDPNTVILHSFKSPGLWCIESDSEPNYLKEIFNNEKSILLTMLDAIGCHPNESNGRAN